MQLVFDLPISKITTIKFADATLQCDAMLVRLDLSNYSGIDDTSGYVVSLDFEDVISVSIYQIRDVVAGVATIGGAPIVDAQTLSRWCEYRDLHSQYFVIERGESSLLKRPVGVHAMLTYVGHPNIDDAIFKSVLFAHCGHLLPEIYLLVAIPLMEVLRASDDYITTARVHGGKKVDSCAGWL